MPKEHEYNTRTRIAKIFRVLLDQPFRYTRKELADKFGVHPDTISGDFEAFKNAEFEVRWDEKNRYAFLENKPFLQLKDLLHFSEEEQTMLYEAIENLPMTTARQQKLREKLASVYDFKKLGHSYLRKPYLTKVDLLTEAQQQKWQVVFEDYRSSNSNSIKNRLVEPFHVSPSEDTVQTFDVEKRVVNHFLISRIKRVKVLDSPWQFEGHHNIRQTDPFRIVTNDQVMVHLRLGVGAFNELVERFPLSKSHIEETDTEGTYDFQCKVNRNFLGLTNFILGFHHKQIEIIEPDSLREHLREAVGKMVF